MGRAPCKGLKDRALLYNLHLERALSKSLMALPFIQESHRAPLAFTVMELLPSVGPLSSKSKAKEWGGPPARG